MCETSIHGRGRASGSEFDATRDGRRTRCVSQSLNTPYARTRATRWITDYTNRFTDLRADLESDNTAYLIPEFTPHSAAPYGECDCAPRP